MRPIGKAMVAARWRAHLARVAAENAGTTDTFDDGTSFPKGTTLHLAVRQRVAPLKRRALPEARMADRPIPPVSATCIEGLFRRRGAFTPSAPEARP